MTTALQVQDRKFWLEFINEYRNLPCLWDKNHVNYSSKKSREKALYRLLEKVQTIRPEAQIDFVKQRLNNFRRTFLNEYDKVQQFKKSGKNTYIPSLYYYNHLRFLKEDEGTQSSEPSEASDEERLFEYEETKDEFLNQSIPLSEYPDEVDYIVTTKIESNSSNEFYLVHSSSNDDLTTNKRLRLMQEPSDSNLDEENHLIEVEEETENTNAEEIETIYKDQQENEKAEHTEVQMTPNFTTGMFPIVETSTEDEFDVMAKRVAMHFRKMSPQQCLYAEKLVFDVCISGRLDRLSENSSLLLPACSNIQQNPNDFNT